DWQLHIRYVQVRDAGAYECQVSSHPPTSLFVHLEVVEAEAEILGAPEKHVKLGSTLRLSVVVESDDHTSVLMVTSANRHHSGNYTCAPSNTKPASILVHILNGDSGSFWLLDTAMESSSVLHLVFLVFL
ncbi:putative lachesin-like 18, partial [Homarus americanus]